MKPHNVNYRDFAGFYAEHEIPENISALLHHMSNRGGREDGWSLHLWGRSRDRWADLVAGQAEDNARLFFRIACKIVLDPAAAEDACQSAYLEALKHPGQIMDRRKIRAWLTRIVVTESLKLVRKFDAERDRLAHTDVGMTPPDRRNDAFVLGEAIARALEKLDPEIRVVFVLLNIDEMSGNQVADLLECSPATVTRKLHQALNQLRVILGEWDDR